VGGEANYKKNKKIILPTFGGVVIAGLKKIKEGEHGSKNLSSAAE